jgi:hypothetical protein
MAGMVELDLSPDAAKLRSFGFIAVAGFGLLAAAAWFEILLFRGGLGEARVPVALGLAAIGLLSGLCSLVAPRLNRGLYVAMILLSFPIGFVLSHVMLATLFFGVFLPIGVLLRVLGKDPLERAADPARGSYWSPARPPRSVDSYFKQF